MVNPLRIGYVNHADTSIVDATSVASLPASNLLDDDIQKLWRDVLTTGSEVRIDLAAQRTIGVGALINTNLITDGTYRLRVSTSDPDGIADNVHDSGELSLTVDPVFGKFAHFIEPEVIGRYLRITTTIDYGPMEAGRLVVGSLWAPSRNMTFGREKLWRDFSTRTQSLGGNEFVDARPRQWGWRFTLFGLTEAEAQQQVDELNRLRGIGRDILVCLDKDSSNLGRDTVWGLLEQPATQRQDHHDFYVVEFEVYNRN